MREKVAVANFKVDTLSQNLPAETDETNEKTCENGLPSEPELNRVCCGQVISILRYSPVVER
jgi:hypothetical protein